MRRTVRERDANPDYNLRSSPTDRTLVPYRADRRNTVDGVRMLATLLAMIASRMMAYTRRAGRARLDLQALAQSRAIVVCCYARVILLVAAGVSLGWQCVGMSRLIGNQLYALTERSLTMPRGMRADNHRACGGIHSAYRQHTSSCQARSGTIKRILWFEASAWIGRAPGAEGESSPSVYFSDRIYLWIQ